MCRLLCDIKNNDAAAGLSIVFSVKHLIFGKNFHAQPFMNFRGIHTICFRLKSSNFFKGDVLPASGRRIDECFISV
jgi:hypothetical protein